LALHAAVPKFKLVKINTVQVLHTSAQLYINWTKLQMHCNIALL